MPRRGPQEGRPRARHGWGAGYSPASGGVGEGHPEASRASDAASRKRAAGRQHLQRRGRLPGDLARPCRQSESESRPDRHDQAPHPNRIPERRARSARARDRCRLDAARRRVQLRVRQRDRRRSLADAVGPVHLGGGEDQPGRGRAPQRVAGRHDDQGPGRPHAGGSSRRPARRYARWGPDPLHVSARRRIRDPDSADARSRRARRGAERSARCGAPARQGPRPGVHGEAASAGGRILGELPAESRPGRSAPHDPRAGERRPARHRRDVSEETVAAAGNRASALSGALQFLPASTDSAGRLLDLDRRSLCGERSGGDAQPPAYFRVASGAARRRRRVRETHPGVAHATSLPASRDGRGPAGPVHALPEGAGRGRLRSGHRDGGVGGAGQPRVPVPRRTGAGRCPAEYGVPRQRSGAGVPALVLPVEQHSGR